ncbi:MAG: dehydrogenase [Aquificaceae bacterium]|nr:dehydrogenase [Aquificaceae bacterium]
MELSPTKVPLTVKEYDSEKVGFCPACGCACGYIAYTKGNMIVDLYGHPADRRGVGSLCTKGITYLQAMRTNPLRLKGIFVRKGEEFMQVDYVQALELLKEKLTKGKTAFLLGRQAGIEEYALARSLTDDVFVDAPVVDFLPSTLEPTQWKSVKFILSVDAEPVFSEVMSTRWLVDAVEAGAYLMCISSRYETLCAKAKDRLLLKPDLTLKFLDALLQPEKGDHKVEFVKKSLFLLRGALVLVGAHLLNSPFREALIHILSRLRVKYGVNYCFVGDLMPFKANGLESFFERIEEFDNLVVVGNLFRYFRDEHLQAVRNKFVVSFQPFPNITAHNSDVCFSLVLSHERDFVNYRHGFGYLVYSPKVVEPEDGTHEPYEVLKEVYGVDVELESYLKPYGVELELLKEHGQAFLKMEDIAQKATEEQKLTGAELFLYTDTTLVEDLGHWNVWTHEMEKYQRAYVNPHTAKKMGLKSRLSLEKAEFEVHLSPNIAEGVIFIPSEYEEFQPFDPGYRVGSFTKKPFYRYEVIA